MEHRHLRQPQRGARARPDLRKTLDRLYAEWPEAAKVEEVIADLYAEWAQKPGDDGPLAAIFKKMSNIIEAVINALTGAGLHSAASVFARVQSGDVGRRSAGREAKDTVSINTMFRLGRAEPGTPQERGIISSALTQAMAGKNRSILGLVPGWPLLAELGKGLLGPTLYLRAKEEMDALRHEWHGKTDEIAQS